MTRRGKTVWWGALALVVAVGVSGYAVRAKLLSEPSTSAVTPTPAATGAASAGSGVESPAARPAPRNFPPDAQTARGLLDGFTVEPGKNWQDYRRDEFGFWNDDTDAVGGRNGCDTRSDLLIRDLDELRVGDRNPCVVFSGVLNDPYTGKVHRYEYRRASQIESDHVVALGAAWRGGAWAWTDAERNEYFNDLDVLLAVDKQANQDKGSKTPDKWEPQPSYRCEYAQRWVGIKHKYRMTVTKAEKKALRGMLDDCPS